MLQNLSLRTFRIWIGSNVLVAHFLCIAIVCYFTIETYEVSDTIAFIGAVVPITGMYGFTYYKYITFARIKLPSEDGCEIGPASWITQMIVIGIFCLAIIVAPVWFFKYGTEADLPSVLAVVETIFGIYIARSFTVLFPVEVLGEGQT